MRLYSTSKLSNQTNIPIPRLPANPSRVDRFIVDLFREYTKVIISKVNYDIKINFLFSLF
jgi:hypothetical protein